MTILSGNEDGKPQDDRVPSVISGRVEMFDQRNYFKTSEKAFVNDLATSTKFTPVEAEKVGGSYSKLFSALHLDADQARDMFNAISGAHFSPPTAEQRAKWESETRTTLVEAYGPDGATQARRDAERLLGKLPALRENLRKLQLTSHPRVLRALADRAREAKKNGRL